MHMENNTSSKKPADIGATLQAQDCEKEADKFEQLKKRLKDHPEDMIILSELMKPKF